MAKNIFIGNIHAPKMRHYQHEMIGEVHRATLILVLQRFGLRAQRNYPKLDVDDVIIQFQGDMVDGKAE